MDARAITTALGGRWAGSYGLARCPVHHDKTPSLKISDDPHRLDGIDLICFAGCDWRDIKGELTRQGLLADFRSRNAGLLTSLLSRAAAPNQNDEADRLRLATNIWCSAVPLPGTLGEQYFVEVRGLDITKLGDLSHCLRWHEGFIAVVALMTDPLTNGPCGIHRTFLNADATKRERKMLGKQGVVRLSPDEDVFEGLGVVEGIEDGLAVLLSGWHPVWVATNCGAIERLPVLAGIEALTIFRDRDNAGERAAEACAERWTSAGRQVLLI
jgi:putative DNA primase/helicase